MLQNGVKPGTDKEYAIFTQILRLDPSVLADREKLLKLLPLIRTKDLNSENPYVSAITDINGYYRKLAEAEKRVRKAKKHLKNAESSLKSSQRNLSAMKRIGNPELVKFSQEYLVEPDQSMVDMAAQDLRREELAKTRLEAQTAEMDAFHQKGLFFRFQSSQSASFLAGLKETPEYKHKDSRKVKKTNGYF